jgi:hypothetical protein
MQTLKETRELRHKMTLFNSLFSFLTDCCIAVASLWPHLLPCQSPSWVGLRWCQPQTRAGSLCTLIQIFWWISYYNPFKDILKKPFETPTSIRLASLSIKSPNSWTRGHELESPVMHGKNLVHDWRREGPWGQAFLQWWPRGVPNM